MVAWSLGAAAVGVLVVAGIAVIVALAGGSGDGAVQARYSGTWERLPDPPLSPRVHIVGVWTGEEALFIGGDTFLCPPTASCPFTGSPTLRDGAAFNPQTNTWRPIANAPVPVGWAAPAMLDNHLYFYEPGFGRAPSFLRYSMLDNAWVELPLPPRHADAYALATTNDSVVAYPPSNAHGDTDYVFDPNSQQWRELPADPMTPGFDRTMVWSDGALYLFDHEMVDRPGSAEPSLTRVARYDPGSGTWERLADSEISGSGTWFAEGGLIINPMLGGADGGEVNNWGRAYPFGGIFDAGANAWRPLPNVPESESSAGVLGTNSGMFFGTKGWFLDLATGEWAELPPFPSSGSYERRNIVSADTDIIAFGGERWSGMDNGRILDDAWIWRSGR